MTGRRSDIEGIRAIAILLVILYHARVPWVSGGFIGVDVFFALSGYLITSLVWSELGRVNRLDLVGFYARRAKRLLPAAMITIIITLAGAWVFLGPLDQFGYTGTALAAATYLSNVWFTLNATDYLAAPPDTNPFLHLWSLAVEEQFYVAWPVTLWAVWRGQRPWRPIALLCLVSLGMTLFFQSNGLNHWAFFLAPGRAWEFGVGALVALRPPALPSGSAWLGVAAILLPAVAYGPVTAFPGLAAIPPVIGTALVLTTPNATLFSLLAWKPMQVIGGSRTAGICGIGPFSCSPARSGQGWVWWDPLHAASLRWG